MPFNLVAYESLCVSLQQAAVSLRKHYNGTIPDNRQSQIDFFFTTIELLDNSTLDDIDKALVLNAAAYYIYMDIYNKHIMFSVNSELYKALASSLKLTHTNQPNKSDLIKMYSSLENFLCNHVYVGANPANGYLAIQVYNIKGFAVINHIKSLIEKINAWKIELIHEAEVKYPNQKVANRTPPRLHKNFLSNPAHSPYVKNEAQNIFFNKP